MGGAEERMHLVEKLFDQALKRKLSQLARKYDPDLVFDLWTRIAKDKDGWDYFNGWKWKPDMTLEETFASLDDYLNGLHALLEKHET